MISRREALATLVGAASLLAGCGSKGSDTFGRQLPPYRYRLSVTVDTPQGPRTGSSVIEVQWSEPGTIMGSQGSAGYKIKGEAVAVDLPGGQKLFVLLRSKADVDWAAYGLRGAVENLKDVRTGADRAVHAVPRSYKLQGEDVDNYPYFVRFRDLRDPKTVEQVDPGDLAKSFGPGVKLKALTVQVTDEPLTRGIETRLGWLASVGRQRATLIERPQRKPGEGLPLLRNATPIQLVSPNDFSTELYK